MKVNVEIDDQLLDKITEIAQGLSVPRDKLITLLLAVKISDIQNLASIYMNIVTPLGPEATELINDCRTHNSFISVVQDLKI